MAALRRFENRGADGASALAAVVVAVAVWFALPVTAAVAPSTDADATFELHTDRPGADYTDFDIANGAKGCQQRCLDDDRCRAWTFVGPDAPEGSGHCWLKGSIPNARPMQTAVSGVVLNLAVERWASEHADLTQLDWVARIVRSGDIDNFGFGWPAAYNPFSGKATPAHGYPFGPDADDPVGTDRIMLGTGYDGHPPNGEDGYTGSTSRPDNKPRAIVVTLPPKRAETDRILLQLFVDDFQAPVFGSYFRVTLDGERMPAIEQVLNALEQTGPIGKLVSIPLLPAYQRLLADNRLELLIDDPTSGAGDGYAIDFVRVLFDPREFPYSAGVRGHVTRADNGKPLAGVLVSMALGQARTDADGRYRLTGVPAGLAVVRAQKDGFEPAASSADLEAGDHATINLQLAVADDSSGELQRQLEQKGRVSVSGIYFDVDSAKLRGASTAALKQVLTLIQEHPGVRYRIEGHTSSQGATAYNLELSRQRAASVVSWLVGHGIAAERLESQGFGETRPVASNDTAGGRALNRRVEVALLSD